MHLINSQRNKAASYPPPGQGSTPAGCEGHRATHTSPWGLRHAANVQGAQAVRGGEGAPGRRGHGERPTGDRRETSLWLWALASAWHCRVHLQPFLRLPSLRLWGGGNKGSPGRCHCHVRSATPGGGMDCQGSLSSGPSTEEALTLTPFCSCPSRRPVLPLPAEPSGLNICCQCRRQVVGVLAGGGEAGGLLPGKPDSRECPSCWPGRVTVPGPSGEMEALLVGRLGASSRPSERRRARRAPLPLPWHPCAHGPRPAAVNALPTAPGLRPPTACRAAPTA